MTLVKEIPFARPWITDAERQAVQEVLRGDVLTHGPQGRAFEEEFGRFVGDNAYCVSLSSGMAALHLTYFQMGIGPGDEVIVPAQTHIATVHAVELTGARPVFLDCEAITGNVDLSRLEGLITPHTRAIGLVHFLGVPCDMDPVMSLADRYRLKVVEDCALAVGARYKGKHVGLFGESGCFSFYPVKHITTGDGGMLVTRHREVAEKAAKARAFGVDRSFSDRTLPGLYDVPSLGLNYRLSDINAALGRAQLARIEENLKRRDSNFRRLKAKLAGVPHVSVLGANTESEASSHYCLSLVLGGPLNDRRNQVAGRLKEDGIGTSVYYPQPVPRMTYYRKKYGYDPAAFPQAEAISDRSIALPVGPHLGSEDVDRIAKSLMSAVEKELHS